MQSIVLSSRAAARRAAVTAASRAVLSRSMATAAAQAARPLSPHLTIYKFRVNMITSVFFRGTGIALVGGGALLMSAYLFAGGKSKDYIAQLQQYPVLNALAKFGITLPLSYHLMGGLRHLAWDNVYGQNAEFVRKTGWGATGAALAIASVAALTEFKSKDAARHSH